MQRIDQPSSEPVTGSAGAATDRAAACECIGTPCKGGMNDRSHTTPSTPPTPRGRARRWLSLTLSAGMALGLTGAVVSMMGMAPEPDVVPQRWELQFDPGQLRVTTVDVPQVGRRPFVWMTYEVTNTSGQDVFFAPQFDLSDGEGNVMRSGRDVPAAVTTKILESTGDQFTQDQVQIIGDILQGPQHAKRGVVIWPLKDLDPTEIVIYVGGLSGESKSVIAPSGKARYVVRKTVRLAYQTPGRIDPTRETTLPLAERTWIMR